MMQLTTPREKQDYGHSDSGTVFGMERMIHEHPPLLLNVALLMGVTLGWLAKRR